MLEALFFESLTQRSLGILGLAFLGGVVSSLLPCTVGMLPILVGYVGGYASADRTVVLRQVLLFILGFSLVLTGLGIAAGWLGLAFGGLVGSGWFYLLGGLTLLMGLQLLGLLNLPLPQLVTRLPQNNSGCMLAPLAMGLAYGAASSPCGTPFLTGILGLISNERNLLLGGTALFSYALGQSMLLLVAGVFTGVIRHLAALRQVGGAIHKLSGLVFVLAGVLLIAQGAGWLEPLAFYP